MSRWNNSFAFNSNPNQYPNPNIWSNDSSSQYINQNSTYYPSSQYVNFNDFMSQLQANGSAQDTSSYGTSSFHNSQIQGNGTVQDANVYGNSSFQNYPRNRYEYSNEPSSSQDVSQFGVFRQSNLDSTANDGINSYLTNLQLNQYIDIPSNVELNIPQEKVLKSNLTPTASEFIPKNTHQISSNQENASSSHSAFPNRESDHTNNDPTNKNKADKVNNKETEPKRTFYNSSYNKPSSNQDVRNSGRPTETHKQRHWGGSQRLRPFQTRINTDDEQFANNYLHYKEDYPEKHGNRGIGTASPLRNRIMYKNGSVGNNTEMTQRERLAEQLDKGTLECLVCCERVKQMDQVWSCTNCYHVLHLRCIRKWAISSMQEGKWRCPACQNISTDVPTEYRCLCGAVRSPEWLRGAAGAHTCGRSCRRPRSCPHPCTQLCHPGPCPPCQATVNKQCGCGAETRSVLCSSKLEQVCGRVCQRKLSCGVHSCTETCHEGPCKECTEIVNQACYCPAAKTRKVPCTIETSTQMNWNCGDTCGRVLACGSHVCRRPCHPPPCPSCELLPENVVTCPCGKMKLEEDKRKSCTDPIPLCSNICVKPLSCGAAGDKHFCKLECHIGVCPVCPDKTLVACRCGHTSREVPCADLPQMINNIFCQKKCNKKLSCGRHRCRELCCGLETHRCPQVCGRTLSCQLHRCEEFCHTGHCPICPQVSFTELTCECGAEVVLPPVRCGAKPPPCSVPCTRRRSCGHPPHHTCHSGDCPPCVVLTTMRCYGEHEERKTIPCSQEEFSCGLPCGKPLSCGKHTCIKTCHKGPCDIAKCTQPCKEKRPSCGHPCGAPCHVGDENNTCPAMTPCRRPVRATCSCGRRSLERACCDNARDYAKMMSTLAASKIQEGVSVDLSDVSRPGANLKTLECDDECRMEARSRQLALALQIRNPDVSSKLAPRYSDHVRQWATRDQTFAQHVHEKLTDLVQLAKKSKQKTRSHSFPSMNRQKRQYIHEMCEHFGCDSIAYDAEPNRNVVATADKEKSWLPAMSVIEVLAREAGKRRVPGPVLRPGLPATATSATNPNTCAVNKSSGGWATLKSTNAWAARSQPTITAQERKPPPIDYFDNPPDN